MPESGLRGRWTLALVVAVLIGASFLSAADKPQPNILLMFTDDSDPEARAARKRAPR